MKILYHHRIRSKDGQYVHLEEMVHALLALGHEVELVGPGNIQNEEFGSDGGLVAVLKEKMPPPVYEMLELTYALADYRRLSVAVRRFRPDVIYERYNLYLPSGIWAQRRHGVPLILEVNAPLFDERSRFGGISLRRVAEWSERFVWRNADIVLPVTGVLARTLRQAGVPDERMQVVHNGINERHFADLPTPDQAKARLGLSGRLVLGFVGFMRDWHGLDRVLRFMAQNRDLDAHALFVGDGPDRARLEKMAIEMDLGDRLTVTGVMKRDAIPATIAAFDVALQPAVVEYASPLKLFEYLAVGLPIVAPDSPNIREILEDGANAVLFASTDESDFSRVLGRLCRDSELRERLGVAARQTVVTQGLTWASNAARVIRLATELMQSRIAR